eukprot:359444_1
MSDTPKGRIRRITMKVRKADLVEVIKKSSVAACVVSFLTLKDLFRLTITSQSMAPYVLYESCKALQRPVPDNGMIDAHVLRVNIYGATEFHKFFSAREAGETWAVKCVSLISCEAHYHDVVSGPLPEIIGNITTLQRLYLGRSGIMGCIPESIGMLKQLKNLYLAGNHISGTIPDSICKLPNLVELSLAGNQMEGALPEAVGDLKNLKYLCLRDNNFSGSIPASIGGLKQLEELWLNSNELRGAIPDSIGELKNLRELYLNNNKLVGPLPLSLEKLARLQVISFRNNQLSGHLPDCQSLKELRFLYLDGNKLCIEDLAITNLCTLANLRTLNLKGNEFENKPIAHNKLISCLSDCVVYV